MWVEREHYAFSPGYTGPKDRRDVGWATGKQVWSQWSECRCHGAEMTEKAGPPTPAMRRGEAEDTPLGPWVKVGGGAGKPAGVSRARVKGRELVRL